MARCLWWGEGKRWNIWVRCFPGVSSGRRSRNPQSREYAIGSGVLQRDCLSMPPGEQEIGV